MKTFLKMLLATILGGAILLFIGFIILASFASLANKEVVIEKGSVLTINLNNVIYERADDNPFGAFNPLSQEPSFPLGLNDILASLKTAANDDNIVGVYLKGGIPMTGNATLEEIRNALRTFRESGKFVYSYSEIMTQKGLFLTSEADSIFMNPEGFFEWNGLNASVTYYKDALDKIGVKPVVLRATGNKYKSAVEPFLRQDMSPENEKQLSDLISSVWGDYLAEISKSRNLDANTLNTLADSMAITSPITAAKNGLIDAPLYEDEVLNLMLPATGKDDIKDIDFVSVHTYASDAKLGKGGYNDNKIAVVIAQGDIVSGKGSEYQIGSERIAEAIRKARKNDKVKAIVLRVNSPGGSALASEVIWREVDLARKEKPVVASMGSVAASGGYYISCFADTIVAQPTTVTGSIGAFGLFFTAEELMHNTLGVNIENVKTNKYSDLGTIDRTLTASEMRMLIRQVDQVYGTFKKRVAEGRGFTEEYVDSIGGGHVYSGRDALELGLVDVLGGLEDAIQIAKNMANIEGSEYRVVEYPELEDPFVRLMKQINGDFEAKLIKEKLGPYANYIDMAENAKTMQGYQTHLGYDLTID
ncbi:signal peptide peptidase SppA, 67K type [Owenweeksia hongkongensis DSM 17368]|uniref:Signal peptide peptidase SppA, 67K type n=1 Tax=Owenweeksia hongkongensis (strain DSM 17368 / CIP 108786 / JCM 12287 / NRRL B-23963 / UST20020801) TaxID=926562 RepID=G8R1Y7_OWEHD|nr:signal peptide peptidase SppA [Owenweeksia hongkongensis]AEV33937.1 signal peptide peptidase SppA, 67K type [Owenweeksia hongkongensis DSM 17368]